MILNNLIGVLSALRYNNKIILVVISIITAALIVDTALIKIYDLISKQSTSSWSIVVFIVISATYIIGQYFVLEFVKQKSMGIRTRKELHLNTIHKMVTVVQYVLGVILVFVILQIVVMSHYNIVLLTAVTAISYTLAITMMVLLAQRFFSWFKLNKNIVVLLYGLSSTIIAVNAVFSLVFVSEILLAKPTEIGPFTSGTVLFIEPGSATAILNYAYVISSITSFFLTWGATTLLLRHYSRRLGRVKYWIIVSIPLAYFLSQFLTLSLNLFEPLLISNPAFFGILLTLSFSLSKPAGGILFGVAFWTVARKLSHNNIVRNYMIISAYGFLLLFVSNQAIVLVSVPYPPFGLVTILFMGLSSYLILIGIYSSAVSVAHDVKLRQSIRKAVEQQSELLGNIGTAQMEQELQKRVIRFVKEHSDKMTEETGVQSSVAEDDMKQYLNEVLTEIKKVPHKQ